MNGRLFLALALAVLWLTVGRADDRADPKLSAPAEKTAARLRAEIRDEIKALGGHAWAGEYYYGHDHVAKVTLILAPKTGYLFEWYGGLDLCDRNYGAIVQRQGRLRLSFTFTNTRKGVQGIAEEFIPVAWGDRTYLIPSDDVVAFCNAINSGSEPRGSVYGMYLLRDGDERKKVTGFPDVPPEYEPYLLNCPIEADIIEVGTVTTRPSVSDWKFKDTQVILNAGKRDGLLPGMELHVTQPHHLHESVTVKQVEEETSRAVMTQVFEDADGPRIGWRLSTWPYLSRSPRTPTKSGGPGQVPETSLQGKPHAGWTVAIVITLLLMFANLFMVRILLRRFGHTRRSTAAGRRRLRW